MRPIMKEEYDKVQQALGTFQDLNKFIDETLIKSFFNTTDRLKQHPLFWYLYKDGNAEKLCNNLKILEKGCNKFDKVIKKIHENDHTLFYSYISEVDVIAYYCSKASHNYQVEFEPTIPEKGTKVDAKITINKKDYFLEIFTIFPDHNFQKIDEMHQIIRERIDAFVDNPYLVCYSIYEEFTDGDIDFFVTEAKKIIDENAKNEQNAPKDNPIVEERMISCRDKNIARVILYRVKNMKKGHVEAMISPVQKVEDAGRIKQKVLSKIDQLPSQGRNIIVVNLSRIYGEKFYDMEDAFLGQQAVFVDKVTLKGTEGRHANGIVHHGKGKFITMIIAYINNDYSTRRYYINDATAIEKLEKEEWKLF